MRTIPTLSALLLSLCATAQPPYPRAHDQNHKLPTPPITEHQATLHQGPALETRAAQQTLWTEDFENGLNGWVVTTSQGNVDWQLTTTGNTGGYTPGPLQSSTGSPGGAWIVADSDLGGTAGQVENSVITSPSIVGFDTVAHMLLSFEQSFRQLNDDQTLVEVSGNGGIDWTVFPVNQEVPGNQSTPGAPVAQRITINISEALDGGSNDIRIRFRWMSDQGYTYSWQVDDVNLIAAADNDIKLTSATYSLWTGDDPDLERLPYSIYPTNEVREMTLMARVLNNGSETQTNVRLQVDIDGPGSNDVQLFSDPIDLDPAESDSLMIPGYTPPGMIGTYEVAFSIAQDQTDDEPGDNSMVQDFEVDNYLFSRDEGTMQSDYANEGDEYELGNWFHVNAFTNTIHGIEVALSDRTDVGSVITATLYDDELNYIIESEEHVVQASELNNVGDSKWITLPLIDPTLLDGDQDYLVSLHHYGGSNEVWVATSGISQDFTSLIYDGVQDDWFYIGVTPMVRMTFDPTADVENTDATPWRPKARPSLFTTGTTITFDLKAPEHMSWELRDMTGRTVRSGDLGMLGSGQQQVDVNGADLASGGYLFSLRGNGRTAVVRLTRGTDR